MSSQISLFDWHDVIELPQKSGYYIVEDRTGRQFRTWYETTVRGFNMIHEGRGYRIVRWRHANLAR